MNLSISFTSRKQIVPFPGKNVHESSILSQLFWVKNDGHVNNGYILPLQSKCDVRRSLSRRISVFT